MGLGYWQKMRLIILPQALRLVIPGIVNIFISLFKDTSLVFIIGLYDLLGIAPADRHRPGLAGPRRRELHLRRLRLLDLLLRHVALQPAARAASSTPATSTDGDTGSDGHGNHAPTAHPASSCATSTSGTASSTCCGTSTSQVKKGQKVVVCGPSGSGKSTMIRCINRLEEHQKGHIVVDGDRAHPRRQERRRHPPRGRHGVPALQPVPAPDDPREPDPGADLGPRRAQGGGRGDGDVLPEPGAHPGAGATNIRASSRAGSSSGSRSPARCA